MCEKCEQEVLDTEINEQVLELTPEQLEALLIDEGTINIPDLLETEMVTSRTLYLSEEITLDTINHIIMLIHKFNRDDYGIPVEERVPIKLYIDSAGGEIYRGFSLVSAIESSDTPVIGILQGTCMSMAFVIYLACHYRYASRFSNVLYHTLRAGSDVQTLIEMENTLRHYKNLQNTLDKYILEKTEIPSKKLKKKRKKNLDWFLT
ncbi:hypothetical protein D7X33_40905, partial [Butyricicoccus sp. 1XD8-22]